MNFTKLFSRINWITGVLTPSAIILMETCCIYPWMLFLGKWPILTVNRDFLSLPAVMFLIGGSYIISNFLLKRKWALKWIQLNIVGIGLLFVFATIRLEYSRGESWFSWGWFTESGNILLDTFAHPNPFVFALPLAFFLWWRGLNRAQHPLYFQNIYPAFLIGIAALTLLIIAWGGSLGISSLNDLTSQIGVYIAGFFFFGLIALALANLQAIQTRLKQKEGTPIPFRRRWLGIVLVVISFVVLLGVGVASLFSLQFIQFLGKVINILSQAIERVAYYIFWPIGWLLEWLILLGKWLIELLRRGQLEVQTGPLEQTPPKDLPTKTPQVLSPELLLILKWGFFILVLVLLIFLLIRAVRRLRAQALDEEIEEENESLWSWQGFKDDLRSLFNRNKPLGNPTARPDWDNRVDRRLTIREIYERFLWQMANLNLPRNSYETPFEYQNRIGRDIKTCLELIDRITVLYVRARYSNTTLNENTTTEVNELWKKLQHEMTGGTRS